MPRVAIAGFQHETNTFAPLKATYAHFEKGEGWPALTRGAAMFKVFPSMNLPIGGFIKEASHLGLDLVPLSWAAAVPSAHVTEDAFERIAGEIIDGLKSAAGSFAAVYLDLHGAMVTEHLEDGEGELLRRVRATAGAAIPVVASLDLHANVTAQMVESADALIAYRTYPHLDMAATGARAAQHTHRLLYGWPKQAKAYRRIPFIMPITSQCTMIEPAKGIYERLAALEGNGVSTLSFAPGFPAADIREMGPAVFAYADTEAAANMAADAVAQDIIAREREFAVERLSPRDAVRRAAEIARTAGRPVVLADVQDNSGAGATSDTTGLLRAMVEAGLEGATLGVLTDPEAAARAHAAGEGAKVELAVGGKAFTAGDPPFEARFRVAKLGSGRFLCTGPFYAGTHADLGPMALLSVNGVNVVVASRRMQAADKEMFRHVGIEPVQQKVLGLKSSVHFRGDFSDIAREILIVEAPGAFIDRPDRLPYKRLRGGIRLGALGPVHQGPR